MALQFYRKLAAKESIEQRHAVAVVPEMLHRVDQHKTIPRVNGSKPKQQVITKKGPVQFNRCGDGAHLAKGCAAAAISICHACGCDRHTKNTCPIMLASVKVLFSQFDIGEE